MGFTGTLVSGADQDPLGPVLAWNTQWYDIPQNLIGAQPIIASNTQCTALQLQITCLGPTVAKLVFYLYHLHLGRSCSRMFQYCGIHHGCCPHVMVSPAWRYQ